MTEEERASAGPVRYVGSFADPTGMAIGCVGVDVTAEDHRAS